MSRIVKSLRLLRHALPGMLIIWSTLIVIGVAVAAFGSPSDRRIAITFFVNVVIVLGLQIFMGNSGVTNFGFISFAAVGAYAAGILTVPVEIKATTIPNAPMGLSKAELSFVPGVLLAVVFTALVALLFGLALTRQVGIATEIATLAMLVIVHVSLVNWVDLTGGARAFYGIPLETTLPLVVGVACATALVARVFRDSEVGLQLRASREDPVAAVAMGVRVQRLRLFAWVLSASIIGLGGALLAHFLGIIDPDAFYLRTTFLIMSMLLLGGWTTSSGPVIGAILVTFAWELMREVEEGPVILGVDLPQFFGLPVLFLGVLIIVVMKFRPSGILANKELDEWLDQLLTPLRMRFQDRVSDSSPSGSAGSSAVEDARSGG